MWLTRLALRHPILILMVSLAVTALGIFTLGRLSVDLFPDITIPVVRVATFYTGAGPADIESSITQPIERAVAAAPGVERVESTSKQGASLVSAWFSYGTNLDNAQFEVQQRVSQILNTLPPGVQQPFVLKFDITNIPVTSLSISCEGLDEKQLYDLAFNVIEPQIEHLQGVASATVGGGKIREIEVEANASLLRARGLGILELVDAVRSTNLMLPSGYLWQGDTNYNVFSNAQILQARELEDVVVKRVADPGHAASGAPVRISDVANVRDATADQNEIARVDGQRGVYLRVVKQPGANTIAVVDAVREAIPKLTGLPAGVRIDVSFDQSTYIRAAVTALQHEALQGALLAALVILVFLTSLRATIIVSIAIPLSIVATFILMYFSGQTLNVFTLGGLALGVGRLVDDSVVELENIHRHLEKDTSRKRAVLGAAKEVAMPIFVSTITTVVVFFPVLFLQGVARNLFVPLALTITYALMASFLVSRTVTPLMCLRGLSTAPPRGLLGVLPRALLAVHDKMDGIYAWMLRRVLRARLVTIGLIMAVFAASLQLVPLIGTEFFPESDEAQVSTVFRTPIGTRVERTEDVGKRIEETAVRLLGFAPSTIGADAALESRPGADGKPGIIRTFLTNVGLPGGRSAIMSQNTGSHSGMMQIRLVPSDRRETSDLEAADLLRKTLPKELPGVQVFLGTGGIVKRILNFGTPAPIDVEILGHDLETGADFASELAARLKALTDTDGRPPVTDVQISREENYPQFDVRVDRQKAGVLGVSETAVAQTVLASLVGSAQFAPTRLSDPTSGNSYNINVRLRDEDRGSLDRLRELQVRAAASGSLVTLTTLAEVARGSGPVTINRRYLQRVIDVTANIAPGKDLGRATELVEQVLADVAVPDGFVVQLGGQSVAQRQAFAGLGLAVLMALGLVYMVLASQFNSLLDPLVIMFSVPLGVSGVFAALYLTKTTLSVNSVMGITMMVGIVVSNGVLLVDFANVLQRRGVPLIEATVVAARTRLRPILMTTIATVAGLMPVAMGVGEGSETNLPLARAVIGGLSVSTVFTLFLIPALYTLLDRFSTHGADEDDVQEAADA